MLGALIGISENPPSSTEESPENVNVPSPVLINPVVTLKEESE